MNKNQLLNKVCEIAPDMYHCGLHPHPLIPGVHYVDFVDEDANTLFRLEGVVKLIDKENLENLFVET